MKKLHQNTYNLIKNYVSSNVEESMYQKKMLEFMAYCSDCFERSCSFGHFTASAFILNKEKTHVLLMHHTKLDKWMQLGGHADGDYNLLDVAIKEAKEESGIEDIVPISEGVFDIDIHFIPPNHKDEAHYHFDVRFLLHAHRNDKFVKNHESKDLRWIEKNSIEIPSKEESVLRMFRKWQNIDA